jgi:hypothetical protein
MLQTGRSRVRDPMRWMNFFSVYLIFPTILGLGVYSASNRNGYQEQRNKVIGVKRGRRVGLTTLPPSVSKLSKQGGILNISQTYKPPQPVTRIALFFSSFYVSRWGCEMLTRVLLLPHERKMDNLRVWHRATSVPVCTIRHELLQRKSKLQIKHCCPYPTCRAVVLAP